MRDLPLPTLPLADIRHLSRSIALDRKDKPGLLRKTWLALRKRQKSVDRCA